MQPPETVETNGNYSLVLKSFSSICIVYDLIFYIKENVAIPEENYVTSTPLKQSKSDQFITPKTKVKTYLLFSPLSLSLKHTVIKCTFFFR